MNDDWQKEIINLKKIRTNRIRFIKYPKEIIIHNVRSNILTDKDLPDIKIINRKSLFRRFVPEAKLDLHGLTKEQAYRELVKFINSCFLMSVKDLLIITGKGQENLGILKRQFPIWMNEPEIRSRIAIVTKADMNYGGEGAFFVKLKSIY